MSQEQTSSDPERSIANQPLLTGTIPRQIALTVVLLSLFAVEPVAAQDNAVCSADNLPGMIEGFFQLTTALGIVGLAIVWQADSLIEMFTLSPDQKKGLKRHKRSAMKSAVVLVVLGPLYTVAGSMMSLPLAECLDLVPW
ncbi:hypothetical protein PM076_15190 [Halorubrum ezzemoulense]|jgi:hypothetical protein|uniref:Uncharacterized protein n=1 Tax=Halorubrum ezzemoulense TaxID=337243 RepID=A0ABT4Z7H3_HALEZ|nr:hypothetical protein [Halorubrum ezzemoulense]MDB2246146.1 hypothetical protein [Halorubrum ezzemoulense]MDB2279793.1 hypothetical protein [Halorubrum ezzemoulense]MDB2290219.1 hypothetical protein [Halorubrum ezzemoulense]MDB2294140.1 hypothetical protein [Halorubrum ezzemoulense]MDB2297619.1 hypothetical protein [Halorubrum ezzemoulense]